MERVTRKKPGYFLLVKRWVFGVLATFGVTAAIAVPLLTTGGNEVPRVTYYMNSSATGHLVTKAQFVAFCKNLSKPQYCLSLVRLVKH